MAHPEINNHTAYHFEPLFLNDEEMQPLFVGLLKATFRIQAAHVGPLIPLKKQVPPVLAGEHYGDPEKSSYKYEPECSPFKLNTDIALIATARAPKPNMTQFDCGFKVGNYSLMARVFGNRVWQRKPTGIAMSKPEIVNEMPLTFENAFGGVDSKTETKHGHPYEQRNPVGKGFHKNAKSCVDNSPLPNIEDPFDLITNCTQCPEPIGFGFTSPNWLPRRLLAGTYDKKWDQQRSPKLATDFNPLFYNASPKKLMAEGYLQGNEEVVVYNASATPQLTFSLPGLAAPTVDVRLKNGRVITLQTVLDTVIVNTDDMLLFLHYRCKHSLPNGPHDVSEIDVAMLDSSPQREI
jgi:hypothetical protein